MKSQRGLDLALDLDADFGFEFGVPVWGFTKDSAIQCQFELRGRFSEMPERVLNVVLDEACQLSGQPRVIGRIGVSVRGPGIPTAIRGVAHEGPDFLSKTVLPQACIFLGARVLA